MGGKNGVRHVVGNKTDYQLDRFATWFEKDPKRAVDDVLDASRPKIKKELLQILLKKFKLGITCIQFLGFLHEQIVRTWLKGVDSWLKSNPKKAEEINFHELDEPQPPNYTIGMARIKNMRFRNYDHNAIKGFCPFEPVVRLEQLLDFPFETFEIEFNISDINFGNTPEWPSGNVQINTPNDVKREIESLKPDLKLWENYYDNLCQLLLKLCARIEPLDV
jgi:hypothetical protein